jgi:hypothetical protein
MLRTIVAAGLIAASAPAFAQAQTGAAQSDTITIENSPEAQRAADRAVPPVLASEAEIAFTVDNEWWNFDTDRSGGLDRAEFAQMLRKFRKFAGTAIKDPAEAERANAAAFDKADLNRDGRVVREEFIALLQSSAA